MYARWRIEVFERHSLKSLLMLSPIGFTSVSIFVQVCRFWKENVCANLQNKWTRLSTSSPTIFNQQIDQFVVFFPTFWMSCKRANQVISTQRSISCGKPGKLFHLFWIFWFLLTLSWPRLLHFDEQSRLALARVELKSWVWTWNG